uniref:Putative 2'-deoxynucleoside 5'-phosphate N-hydrolase 1 n=1 Tax=Plectus sambesii TaxID=2011161 RepID=A0A914UJJ7_9BILA
MTHRIYFCGSIRAGRQDAELYQILIKKLQKYGKVLTEHIGLNEPWNAPHLSGFTLGQEDLAKDKCIFKTDTDWLASADVVVAECTQPSLGVGFELGFAWKLNKPTLCLYRPLNGTGTAGLSAMITGAASDSWTITHYNEPDELDQAFEQLFQKLELTKNSNSQC